MRPAKLTGPWRGAALASGERCREAIHVIHHIDRQRLRAVTDRQFMAWILGEVEPYAQRHLLREDHLAVVFLRQPFEPTGDVDGITHCGQVGGLGIAHVPDNGWSGVDSDAHTEWFR